MTKQNISARFISAIKRGYRGIFSCINLVQLFFVTKKEAKLKSQERAVESELKQIKKKSGVKGAQFEKAHTYFYTKSIKHIRTWRRYKPTTKVALVGGMVVLLVASSLSLNLLFNGTGKAANPERAFEQQVELLNKAITISSSGAYATVGSAAGMSVSLDYSSYFLYTASNYSLNNLDL